MKRGNIVVARLPGSPMSKARPFLVVQRTSTIENSTKITVCAMTSALLGGTSTRPSVTPTAENGLRAVSEIEIDWIYTVPKSNVAGVIGTLDHQTVTQVDIALRRWLDL